MKTRFDSLTRTYAKKPTLAGSQNQQKVMTLRELWIHKLIPKHSKSLLVSTDQILKNSLYRMIFSTFVRHFMHKYAKNYQLSQNWAIFVKYGNFSVSLYAVFPQNYKNPQFSAPLAPKNVCFNN